MRSFFSHRISRILRAPEVQFFLVFSIPFIGFFLINYNMAPKQFKLAAIVVCAATLVVVLLQTVYSVYAHWRQKQQDNTFLAMTAHQMRTPITAIQWVLQELLRQDIKENERADLVRAAGVAGSKLVSIIDAFEQSGRLDERQGGETQELIELGDFASQIVTEMEPVAKQYGITISFERPTERVEIAGDSFQLEMALTNLVSNGIKYNHFGGVVTLHVRALTHEHEAEIIVEDSGIGLTPAEQAKLFTKYYRTEGAQRANIPGAGLGLYLTKHIIEQHHGRIFVESVAGKGSSFRIILPLAR